MIKIFRTRENWDSPLVEEGHPLILDLKVVRQQTVVVVLVEIKKVNRIAVIIRRHSAAV